MFDNFNLCVCILLAASFRVLPSVSNFPDSSADFFHAPKILLELFCVSPQLFPKLFCSFALWIPKYTLSKMRKILPILFLELKRLWNSKKAFKHRPEIEGNASISRWDHYRTENSRILGRDLKNCIEFWFLEHSLYCKFLKKQPSWLCEGGYTLRYRIAV